MIRFLHIAGVIALVLSAEVRLTATVPADRGSDRAAPAWSCSKAQGERRPELTHVVNEDAERSFVSTQDRRGNEAAGLRVSGTKDRETCKAILNELLVATVDWPAKLESIRDGFIAAEREDGSKAAADALKAITKLRLIATAGIGDDDSDEVALYKVTQARTRFGIARSATARALTVALSAPMVPPELVDLIRAFGEEMDQVVKCIFEQSERVP